MKIENNWELIKKIFENGRSSFHCSVATVNQDGTPNVIPIGSLFLRDDFTGFFFDTNLNKTAKNLQLNKKVCVLVVNSDFGYWEKSIKEGKFDPPPAVKLMGEAITKRKATEEELRRWHEHISYFENTPGYNILWKKMNLVWDLKFDSFEPTSLPDEIIGNPWK